MLIYLLLFNLLVINLLTVVYAVELCSKYSWYLVLFNFFLHYLMYLLHQI